MGYGPPVIKQCEYCNKDFKCANSRATKARFCSITCHNKSGALPRTKYTCVNCNDTFLARPDHGAERRFCSRECFSANALPPIEKECENCGGMFTASRSSTATRGDGYRLYCSFKCSVEGRRSFEEKPCAVCGTAFYPGSSKKAAAQQTCSNKCRLEFYTGPNTHNYQGGEHVRKADNHKYVLIGKREGYVGKYIAAHRLIAAQQIGRMLVRGEVVIHINNNGLDNSPDNLFICESMSEFASRKQGSLPWPKKSNLQHYKEKANETTNAT